jgi:adenosylcobinamide-GDP ribazoletransferase
MKEIISNFLLMIQFLTRIPVNMSLPCERDNFRKASIFFPIIGLIVGSIQWIIYELLAGILPSDAVIVIVILAGIIITGALHIDGLGDTCDGFFAFKGNDRIIEIMKDSRIGTYACIVIVMDLLLKYTLFTYIVHQFSVAIIVVPVISRFSLVLLGFRGKYAKCTCSLNLFIGNIGRSQLLISFIITVVILMVIIDLKYLAVMLLLVAFIVTFLFNSFCEKKIGGLTGDTLGANNELVEIMILILIAAVM